jgi:hypothetical protein
MQKLERAFQSETANLLLLVTSISSEENFMFASLEEQMKVDDATAASPRQRVTKWAVIGVVAVVVFGALYYALQSIG